MKFASDQLSSVSYHPSIPIRVFVSGPYKGPMLVLSRARAKTIFRLNCQPWSQTTPSRPVAAAQYRFAISSQGSQYSSKVEPTGGSAKNDFSSITYSENQPADLPNRVSNLSAWKVTPSRMGLIRQYTFPTFNSAWRFMSLVADECKAKRHHPSWHNLYNQVTVEWTTHKPQGLSIKDVEMAEFCDRTAQQIGLKENAASPTASTPPSS
ncbi:transcriptional coactivator/pterin dehydratase [Westerdykella ornata]|uniref:4a-hydroxytetrahydrobiopterin dehydratase n=1 Tax=Westerdykella ornata TaxID=318751 RepID=A0A6A6JW12_WESOR|nr:transcriptional coactivator/pterin dehydratase [Westerdykella ornata]KAF2280293.1 transcriptional coactivator/pterin dehydratase [Westerdykella ornata]